ncbi:MAG: SMI1/KNR4 family protein [Gemmataceae bacterium]|jgi:cell wall assembly regulator SMI1|nr:SMI1/KNR4 family protein [Gemmataceae bacterium]
MQYPELFERVFVQLKQLGIEYSVTFGARVFPRQIRAIEKELSCRFPPEFREFYLTVGNGVILYWPANPDTDALGPWGVLIIPSLSSLMEINQRWRDIALYSPEKANEYGFPYTKDPALAKQTAARMWQWLPLIEHHNGDAIALDLGAVGCPVVFDQHDWFDGGTGDNGFPLAPNFKAFLWGWGSICFQEPLDCYWPRCFKPTGGVDWYGKFFDQKFCIPNLRQALAETF